MLIKFKKQKIIKVNFFEKKIRISLFYKKFFKFMLEIKTQTYISLSFKLEFFQALHIIPFSNNSLIISVFPFEDAQSKAFCPCKFF